MPSTWMLAREKPHCGVSGVPFMNKTTGADPTALSIAWRTASDSNRRWEASERRKVVDGEAAAGRRVGRTAAEKEAVAGRTA